MAKRMKRCGKTIVLWLAFMVLLFLPGNALAKGQESYDVAELCARCRTYFYDQLTDMEKELYDTMLAADADAERVTFDYYATSANTVSLERAYYAMIQDHPEKHMFWQRSFSYYNSPAAQLTVLPYKMTIASDYRYEKAMARAEAIAAEIGKYDDLYTRVLELTDYFFRNTCYEYEYGISGSSTRSLTMDDDTLELLFNDSVYGCLLCDTAICAGFAETFKLICDMCDIPCIIVTDDGHAWNMILMDDGQWYAQDISVTSQNGQSAYEHSLLGTNSWWYAQNTNYFLGGGMGCTRPDFVYPQQAAEQYCLTDDYVCSGFTERTSFTEPAPRFVYEVLEGGCCRITQYEGPQNGTLTIPKTIDGYTVTQIGSSAFYRTKFTGDIVIPNTVEMIGGGAFDAASFDGSLIFEEGSQIGYLGKCAFAHCNSLNGNVTLPNSLYHFGNYLFYKDASLNGSVKLPDCPLGTSFSAGTGITDLLVYDTNTAYSSYDGCLYSADGKELIMIPGGKTGTVTVREGCTKIRRRCAEFAGFDMIVFPDSLLEIDDEAFANHLFSGKLILPEKLQRVGNYALMGDRYAETTISALPRSLKDIGDYAFWNCWFDQDVYLDEGLTYLGTGAFESGIVRKVCYYSGNAYIQNHPSCVAESFFCSMQTPKCGKCTPGDPVYETTVNWTCETTACRYCSVCGFLVSREKTDPQHLVDVYYSFSDATCTADGTKYGYCRRCSQWVFVPDVGSGGHKVEEWTVDETGHSGVCRVCGAVIGPEAHTVNWEKLVSDGNCVHSHQCICGYSAGDYEAHVFGAPDEYGIRRCGCGYEIEQDQQIFSAELTVSRLPGDSFSFGGTVETNSGCDGIRVTWYKGNQPVGSSFLYTENGRAELPAVELPQPEEGKELRLIASGFVYRADTGMMMQIPGGAVWTYEGAQPLAAPILRIAMDEESGRPVVSWDAVDGAVKYLVYRKAGSNNWALQTTAGITATTYQSSKATVGNTYKYRVIAVSPDGKEFNSDYSNTVTMDCILAAPVLTLTTDAAGLPVLSWNSLTGASSYQIWRKIGTGEWKSLKTGFTGTSYTDSGLTLGTKYSYRIKAVAAAGDAYNSVFSIQVSLTYTNPTLPAPVLSIAMDYETGRPVVTWDAVPGASKYLVYRKAGSNSWALQTSDGITATRYQSSKATVGTTYKYRVIAVSPEGKAFNSDYSESVTMACILPQPQLTLTKDAGTGAPVISWKALTGASGYDLYRKAGTAGWKSLAAGLTETSYTDSGLTEGTEYSYKLVARAGAGTAYDSAESNAVSVTFENPALPAPVLSIAMDEETGRPVISWEPVEGASKYMVYRKAGSNSWALQTSSGTTETSYQSSKATVGTTYKYRVVAVSPEGKAYNSDYSASVTMACIAAKPAVSIERDKVSGCPVISWKAVTGADAYRIYRKAGDGSWTQACPDVTGTSFTDSGLTVGTKYSYRVIAVSAKGIAYNSFESKTVSETCVLPAPVVTLSRDASTGKPVISWEPVEGASKYYVYRKAGSNSWALQTTGGTTETRWVNSKVNDGSTYQYRVVAVCPIGKAYNSGYSNVVSLTYTAK